MGYSLLNKRIIWRVVAVRTRFIYRDGVRDLGAIGSKAWARWWREYIFSYTRLLSGGISFCPVLIGIFRINVETGFCLVSLRILVDCYYCGPYSASPSIIFRRPRFWSFCYANLSDVSKRCFGEPFDWRAFQMFLGYPLVLLNLLITSLSLFNDSSCHLFASLTSLSTAWGFFLCWAIFWNFYLDISLKVAHSVLSIARNEYTFFLPSLFVVYFFVLVTLFTSLVFAAWMDDGDL